MYGFQRGITLLYNLLYNEYTKEKNIIKTKKIRTYLLKVIVSKIEFNIPKHISNRSFNPYLQHQILFLLTKFNTQNRFIFITGLRYTEYSDYKKNV